MKKVLISVLMLAGGLQAADVVCEWTGGETNPGSLADGAVSLTYDDSGVILSLIATPVDGGTIAVTGDSMNFAANAKITVAAEGRLIISNAMTLKRGASARLGDKVVETAIKPSR